jgi:lysophospholipase L1-like esterase
LPRRYLFRSAGLVFVTGVLAGCGIDPNKINADGIETPESNGLSQTPESTPRPITKPGTIAVQETTIAPVEQTPVNSPVIKTQTPENEVTPEVNNDTQEVLILGDSFAGGLLPNKIGGILEDCNIEFQGTSKGFAGETKMVDFEGATISKIAGKVQEGTWVDRDGNERSIDEVGNIDILVMRMGTNDLSQGSEYFRNESGPKLVEIVNFFKSRNENLRVIVGAVPHTSTNSDKYVNELNEQFQKEVEYLTGISIDITYVSFDNFDPRYDAGEDGVHPNNSGIQKLAEGYANVLREMIGEACPSHS